MARWIVLSIRAGAPVRSSLHLNAAAALRAELTGHAPQQILEPIDHGWVIVRGSETTFPQLPGMMLGAPGSSGMRPVVHTVRGAHCAGKRSSIATQNLASASPASRRTSIRVVPA